MFKFLKDKFKDVVDKFSKKVEEEGKEVKPEIEEKKIIVEQKKKTKKIKSVKKKKPSKVIIKEEKILIEKEKPIEVKEEPKKKSFFENLKDKIVEKPKVLEEESSLNEHKHKKLLAQLTKRDNVIITPHNAFNTQEAMQRILDTTTETIQGIIDNKPLQNKIQ